MTESLADLPAAITINEEGPREGFQIEPEPVATADKVRLIEGLAGTGVRKIDCVSFVNPHRVPGMADADTVARTFERRPGIRYTGLWLNTKGLERALASPLDVVGVIRLTASETFAVRNTGMDHAATLSEQRRWLERYVANGITLETAYVMTAFGCNFEGPIATGVVISLIRTIHDLAEEFGMPVPRLFLADTVGHATPSSVERLVDRIRDCWPDLRLGLHLHDTRGLGVANAWAAMRLGVDEFDSSCAGLGGCPFAGHRGAAGNVCTEELVFLCDESGIETGINLDAAIECARLAESIVGHELPGKLTRGGGLAALRRGIRQRPSQVAVRP